jgi:NAD(P)-dependent dehydrogenase (short-subunit alcohol dehydrogenase family)
MDIKGRAALVTIAGPGIVQALAEPFAAAGGAVAMRTVKVDADIRAMLGLAATNSDRCTHFATAGIGGPPGLGTSAEDSDHVLDVNVRAHIRAAAELVTG